MSTRTQLIINQHGLKFLTGNVHITCPECGTYEMDVENIYGGISPDYVVYQLVCPTCYCGVQIKYDKPEEEK